MKKVSRVLSFILVLCMMLTLLPMTVFASNAPAISVSDDNYNRVVSQKNYAIAPDISEAEIVMNDASGKNQNKSYIMEVSPNSEYATIMASYKDQNPDVWGTQVMSAQAASAESKYGVNVVGAINCNLRFGSEEPIGMLVINGEVCHEELTSYGYLVLTNDGKYEIREGTQPLDGSEYQAVTANMGWLVRDGQPVQDINDHEQGSRAPRTAIGLKADGTLVLVVNDGRQVPVSVGFSMGELAQTMIDLGCVTAINCDGGGTSTFLSEREGTGELELRNTPSDGAERATLGGLLVISTAKPSGEFDHASVTPNEEIYTPDSAIELNALGVDYSGSASNAIPESVRFELSKGSENMGVIAQGEISGNNATATFVSNGTEGEVVINLVDGDKEVGSATIYIATPNELSFTSDTTNLVYGQTTDLGLVAKYQGNVVNLSDGDIEWSIPSFTYGGYPWSFVDGYAKGSFSVSATTNNATYPFASILAEIDGESVSWKFLTYTKKDGGQVVSVDEILPQDAISWTDDNGVLTATTTCSVNNSGTIMNLTLSWKVDFDCLKGQLVNGQPDWSVSNPVGTFNGLTFTATNDYMASFVAKVMAKYKDLSAETTINIGVQPSIVLDGGDGDGLDYSSFARGSGSGGNFIWERGDKTITAEEYNALSDEEKASYAQKYDDANTYIYTSDVISVHYTNGVGGTSRGGNESLELVTSDMPEWTDLIRFGNNAVKLNYDFTNINGIEGACVGFGKDIDLTGSPTAIGCWVYAPEGTPNFWLRAAVGVETSPGSGTFAYTYVNFTTQCSVARAADANDFGGINWTGWKYVEADLSQYAGRTIRIMKGETIRVMHCYGNYGTTNNGISAGQGCWTIDGTYVPFEECTGWILVDNLQFVYGANNEDVTEPQINSIVYVNEDGSTAELENGTEFDTNYPMIRFYYDDCELTDRYASGVVTKLFYFDGGNEGSGQDFSGEGFNQHHVYLANGTHSVTCYIKDGNGNVTKETRYFTVNGDESFPNVSIEYDENAKLYLGDTYELNVCSNEPVSNIKEVYCKFAINKNYGVKEVVPAAGYTIDRYSFKNGTLEFAAIPNGNAVESETVATVVISVPTALAVGSSFDWRLEQGWLSIKEDTRTEDGLELDYGFATSTVTLGVAAKYSVSCDTMVVGFDSTIKVVDEDGVAAANVSVYSGDELVGITNENGKLVTDYFTKAVGTWVVVAKDEIGAVSFPTSFTSYPATGEDVPYYIITNAVENPSTQKNISWMANPSAANQAAIMKVSVSADMSDTKEFVGTSKTLSYNTTATANLVNNVVASGLNAGTTYYYQVGDGNIWSDVRSFTTAAVYEESTNFFIMGDMQGEDAVVANAFSDIMLSSGKDYAFGVQLGDAVDNVTKYDEWQKLLGVFSNGIYKNTDIIHVIGNHETFSDSNADAARAVFGSPVSTADGWYSVEYGNVYVAVMGYTLNRERMAQALEWLVEDAQQTECPWKILVIHVPTYNTNSEQGDSDFYTHNLPAAAEAAGIDFVFSGHDHSYARTYPVIGGEKADDGVVYYIAGTAGEKKYTCAGNGHPFYVYNQDFNAIFLDCTATDESITINTCNVDAAGNKSVIDTVTKCGYVCEEHNLIYDRTTDILSCTECAHKESAAESLYSGWATDSQTGKLMYFAGGKYVTGDIKINANDSAYFDANGFAVNGEVTICGELCTFANGVYAGAANKNVDAAGYVGTNIYWVLYTDGKMIVDGEGEIRTFGSAVDTPWSAKMEDISTLNIGANITKIGRMAFYHAYGIAEVNFETDSKLQKIEKGAFLYCNKLDSIVLPNKVNEIGVNAFAYCKSLTSVTMPDGISNIASNAFAKCNDDLVLNVAQDSYALEYAQNNGIKYVVRESDIYPVDAGSCGKSVFWEYYANGTLVLSGSGAMTDYDSMDEVPWAEYMGKITCVEVGADVTTVGAYAFYHAYKLTKVSFAEGSKLESIEVAAFVYDYKLTSITLPDGVAAIKKSAFNSCKALENVYLPDGMKKIHSSSFTKCTALTLSVAEGSYAEEYAKNNNIKYVSRELIPECVANGKCGENVEWTIYNDGTLVLGGNGAMTNYSGMSEVPWADYMNDIKKVDVGANVTTIGAYSFYHAYNLKQIVFSEGSKLESIEVAAFVYDYKLISITLPDGVATVKKSAFNSCKALADVYLPDGVKSIHSSAFIKCTALTLNVAEGTYAEDYAKANSINYVSRAFVRDEIASGKCGENVEWTYYNDNTLAISGEGKMDSYKSMNEVPWVQYMGDITKVEVGENVENIGAYAFYHAYKLEEIEFFTDKDGKTKLEAVETAAFVYDNKLKEVVLPDTVTSIGKSAFNNCSAIENFFVPDAVVSIHSTAFVRCSSLVLNVPANGYAMNYAVIHSLNYVTR